jgi:hypothetical protein
MPQDIKQLLKSITDLWIKQVRVCERSKKRHFDDAADAVMQYVGKEYEPIRVERDGGDWGYDLVTIMNYTQSFVDILTPYCFASVPNRLVSPRSPQIPPELELYLPDAVQWQEAAKKRDTLVCFLLQWWLNFSPKIYNLTREGKMVVQEALGKGRGTIWLEMIDSAVGEIPSSNADTVDNLLIDADAKQLRDAGFIIRRREQVNYRIAEIWGEDVEEIRGTDQSAMAEVVASMDGGNTKEDKDKSVYYEVWSVIGLGHKLVGAADELNKDNPLMDALEQIGPYVHFAVMPGLDHPLGMGPDVVTAVGSSEEFLARMAAMLDWPIKTYENPDNPWPMKPLDFRPHLEDPWASPLLEQALPLQAFIDRIYHTLLNRCETAGRDIVLRSAALDDALKDALVSGADLEVVEVMGEVPESLEKLVGFMRFPELKRDILEILELADRAFRELTGLDPAMFGGIPKSQDRSAEATQVREAGLARRPDDYADAVEAWMSDVSAGEAVASRMLVSPETIARLVHEPITDQAGMPVEEGAEPEQVIYGPLTQAWVEFVYTDDPAVASAEVAYTVEAGSGRRRNKQLLQQNAQQLYTMLGQQFYDLGLQLGIMDPYVALLRLVGDAYDMPVEPLIEAFEEAIAAASGQPGQTAPDVVPGEEPPPEEPPPV